ncbi:MAG: protein kinase [SAR202 cluster bacterium]|nr:protein kinase [SAR202 cluster bacterium]
MVSERIQRQIDRLRDEAEQASAEQNWELVLEKARYVLTFDPENSARAAFLAVAESALGVSQSNDPAPATIVPAVSPGAIPSSFANGRYQVKSFLREGGQKMVYLARDTLLDRDVAFALIKTHGLDDTSRARISREAQTMGRLGSHPHIVTVFDLGEHEGEPFIVTELMGGGDVQAILENTEGGKLPLEQAISIAIQTCRGLEFAHSSEIIHRDLKPGNVWLTEDGVAKIGDFGLAVSTDLSRLTTEGIMVGTVSYMPPEQATGGEVTPQADLYSLGAMLYEMVCGRPPFVGGDHITIMGQHINAPPEAPTRRRSDCPKPLEELILRLLSKDPSERPESAADVLTVLEGKDFSSAPGAFVGRQFEEGKSPDGLDYALLQAPLSSAASPATHPNNLPSRLTSFIGREQQIKEVRDLLSTARLVTLAGAGGCGKTRLSLQVASMALDEYPDGVWFVELAPVADPILVAQTVATTLGIREEPGQPLIATLSRSLQAKKMLLALDNCEHLVGACAKLVNTLLAACPELQVLATSRESLGVAGENVWRVSPLSAPGPDQAQTTERLMEYESVKLFVERAIAAEPTFTITNQTAPVVAQICQRLEGIPLAIELTAARVRVLSVEQIAERLEDRFRLLTGGARTVLPRQQTLRAAVEWGYDLLSEPEQALFNRLSVFAGGFTLEAVESAWAGEGVEEYEILDLVSSLVDKSLMVVVDGAGGSARYGLLETLREYGWERLVERGESEETQRRHAACFVALAEEAEPELRGPQQVSWLERLEQEHDNVRAALSWSAESGDGETGLRLGGALWPFWLTRGYLSEGRERLAGALALPSGLEGTATRANALNGLGNMALSQGDYSAAWALYEESLAIRRELREETHRRFAQQPGTHRRKTGRLCRGASVLCGVPGDI